MKKLLLILTLLTASLPVTAKTVEMTVDGLVCAFCAQGIEKKLRQLDATDDVLVSLEAKLVAMTLKDGQDVTDATLTELLRDAGYTLKSVKRTDTALETLRAQTQKP